MWNNSKMDPEPEERSSDAQDRTREQVLPISVPGTWLLILQPREAAPLLEHTTPRRRPERVRYPWER